ncbi:20S-pre-rRNA D-site endonuclease nob1 [Erysiphe neolycopersici]|uniref:20S-pre-rRNA D-site endonuclease NOB1 n=1 Tax=Erysiphe neolycopersici TaxID=212602 RepID=A0A420HNG6_9PEZI|nr:20S-pre-rRNA D-site endonuclease nob1 [Erysiphe neolycopersici]
MATNNIKRMHSLVLDTGPIIKNDPSISTLLSQAEALYTVPSVLEEIRDATTRMRLESTLIPFLKIRSPQQASVKVIRDFARKTGDLEVLSRTDIHLMALAYELECERNHGNWRLRSSPGQKRLNGAPPISLCERDSVFATSGLDSGQENLSQEVDIPEEKLICDAEKSNHERKYLLSTDEQEALKNLDLSDKEHQLSQNDELRNSVDEGLLTRSISEPLLGGVSIAEDESSDDEGWIKPSNLKRRQESDRGVATTPNDKVKVIQAAIITNDFAMQNVLLRMNINILSSNLQRISNLRTWVLRCHACFKITKNMERQFCESCGKPTLLRVACSTGTDGNFKLYLKKNKQWNTRGNVYSIPKPRSGTSSGKFMAEGKKGEWGSRLILAEDQKEYVNALGIERRAKMRDLLDDDFSPGLLSGIRGERRNHGNRPNIGAGRNINSRKRK